MTSTYKHYEFKQAHNYLLMGYVLSTSFDAARGLFARVTGVPRDLVGKLAVLETGMWVSADTILPSDETDSRPHNMMERDQSGKRFHLNPEPENKKAEAPEPSAGVKTALADLKSVHRWLAEEEGKPFDLRQRNAREQIEFAIKVFTPQEEKPVASDLYEALGLMEHVKNALNGPGINKAALDWITQAKAIVLRAANQPSTDDVVVPRELGQRILGILKFIKERTNHRFITEFESTEYVKPFDDLVYPKTTRTFHVEVTGTPYDLERALENIRKVATANSLEASVSEDTQ